MGALVEGLDGNYRGQSEAYERDFMEEVGLEKRTTTNSAIFAPKRARPRFSVIFSSTGWYTQAESSEIYWFFVSHAGSANNSVHVYF
jgi:hypothetical protein